MGSGINTAHVAGIVSRAKQISNQERGDDCGAIHPRTGEFMRSSGFRPTRDSLLSTGILIRRTSALPCSTRFGACGSCVHRYVAAALSRAWARRPRCGGWILSLKSTGIPRSTWPQARCDRPLPDTGTTPCSGDLTGGAAPGAFITRKARSIDS